MTLEEVAKYLLNASCESARNRCNRSQGKYKDIQCELTPTNLLRELMKKKAFWEDWLRVTKLFIESDYDASLRPTLDRINSDGHYDVNNIQVLPHNKNTSKGALKQCAVISYNKQAKELYCNVILGVTKTMEELGMKVSDIPKENKGLLANINYVIFVID